MYIKCIVDGKVWDLEDEDLAEMRFKKIHWVGCGTHQYTRHGRLQMNKKDGRDLEREGQF